LHSIGSYYNETGSEVDVFILSKKKFGGWERYEDRFNISYSLFQNHLIGFIWLFFKILFTKKRYDIAYSSHVHTNSFLGFLKRIKIVKTKKIVGRESTTIFKRFSGSKLFIFKFLYKLGYSGIDVLICQTRMMKEELVLNLPYLTKVTNITTLPNPINLTLVNNSVQEKKEINYTNFIVSAGRLITLKGFDILIQAFNNIKHKESYSDLKLLILGEGEERENLEVLSKQTQCNEDVHLIGHVDNVYPYFKKARVCVVSSIIEGFPNVLLQMMSQNEHVVSTLCADGIHDIEGIITCNTESIEALELAMIKALDNTENLSLSKQNRILFDNELSNRSNNNYVNKIHSELDISFK